MSENVRVIHIKRSEEAERFISTISEHAKMTGLEENFLPLLEELRKRGRIEMPSVSLKYPAVLKEYKGTQYFEISKDDSYDKIVLYIHGGAYLFNMDQNNVDFMERLLCRRNLKVVIPAYQLAPNACWEEAHDLVSYLYDAISEEGKEIIMIGDSAGAGLTLGFAEYLSKTGKKLPDKIVLASPWLDASLSQKEAEEIEKRDEILTKFELVTAGKIWAGELSTKDYRVSPIYGDVSDLPDMLIIVGTREVMLPDARLLFEKIKDSGKKAWIVYGEELFHDFAVFPIPEAEEAADIIAEFLH